MEVRDHFKQNNKFARRLTTYAQMHFSHAGTQFPGRGPDGQDDMILTSEQIEYFLGLVPEANVSRNGWKDLKYRWPRGHVFYQMDSSFSK